MNFRTVLNIRALSNVRDEVQAQSIAEETDSGLRSLRLDDTWDLTLSAGGDLASAGGTVRIVQDVASYVRTFQGEPYYAQQDGIPYFIRELGSLPPAELVRARSNARALEVPGVAQADTQLSRLEKRTLSGTIRITTETGETADVTV